MKLNDEKVVFNNVMPAKKYKLRSKNDLKTTNPELYEALLDK